MTINRLKTISDLNAWRAEIEKSGKTIAFVPTMGALHDGHLSLVKAGLEKCDAVIVSIFVNPTQFAPHEDFDSYPRTIDKDVEKLSKAGVSAVWLPDAADIYPDGVASDIHITGVSEPLEGTFRPTHFDGVATVVARLLRAVKPNLAIFGQKDYQQLQVIQKMVAQENIDVTIFGAPIMRDENGLALSSRNLYLSDDEYQIAIQLNKILKLFADQKISEEEAIEKLLDAGFDKVDYCTARHKDDLSEENPSRVLVAAWLGKTRLIDNMPMNK